MDFDSFPVSILTARATDNRAILEKDIYFLVFHVEPRLKTEIDLLLLYFK